MPTLGTELLEPGMILSEPACGPRGNVLLGKGVQLSARHIEALRNWGVDSVKIEGQLAEAVDTLEDLSASKLARIKAQVMPRFAHARLDNPLMARLLAYALRQQAQLHNGDAHE